MRSFISTFTFQFNESKSIMSEVGTDKAVTANGEEAPVKTAKQLEKEAKKAAKTAKFLEKQDKKAAVAPKEVS